MFEWKEEIFNANYADYTDKKKHLVLIISYLCNRRNLR